MELLQEIESYWTTRTEGYSEVNQKELAGMQKQAWLDVLTDHFPKKEKKNLRILDIGTGPGFFPTILSEAGYEIDAADYTPGMLEKARENVGKYADKVRFWREDAQNLDFENETFDVIISRNLTWNLEEPARAYAEWMRVLKPGGKLLNFDANWYGYLYDDSKREAYEEDRKNVESAALDDHYTCTDIDRMEQIALQMPLSAIHRPVWDAKVLRSIGFTEIAIDQEIWKTVWSEEEKLNYASTPMFMIEAVKPEIETKKRVTSYWSKRSDDFMKHKRAELHSVQAERWMNEIHRFLPAATALSAVLHQASRCSGHSRRCLPRPFPADTTRSPTPPAQRRHRRPKRRYTVPWPAPAPDFGRWTRRRWACGTRECGGLLRRSRRTGSENRPGYHRR